MLLRLFSKGKPFYHRVRQFLSQKLFPVTISIVIFNIFFFSNYAFVLHIKSSKPQLTFFPFFPSRRCAHGLSLTTREEPAPRQLAEQHWPGHRATSILLPSPPPRTDSVSILVKTYFPWHPQPLHKRTDKRLL